MPSVKYLTFNDCAAKPENLLALLVGVDSEPEYRGPPFQLWMTAWALEAFRVLKPGGHLLAFSGSRTYHRLASAVEDAGFEVRDTINWVYSTGFPKSHDVSKAADKAAGVSEQRGYLETPTGGLHNGTGASIQYSKNSRQLADNPITDIAKTHDGWGTALKPSHEPIIVARKPLVGTVVENVKRFGVGGLNIDATRVGLNPVADRSQLRVMNATVKIDDGRHHWGMNAPGVKEVLTTAGRWPPNLLLTHDPRCQKTGTKTIKRNVVAKDLSRPSPPPDGRPFDGRGSGFSIGVVDEETEAWTCVPECPVSELDRQSGITSSAVWPNRPEGTSHVFGAGKGPNAREFPQGYTDEGGASRFFPQFGWDDDERSFVYCPKASRGEREAGLDDLPSVRTAVELEGVDPDDVLEGRTDGKVKNRHPTVKPIALMRWLCRLVTPPGGLVLDPFAGSGTTGVAARLEGFRFLGVEQDADHIATAEMRIAYWEEQPIYTAPIAKVQKSPERTVAENVASLSDDW